MADEVHGLDALGGIESGPVPPVKRHRLTPLRTIGVLDIAAFASVVLASCGGDDPVEPGITQVFRYDDAYAESIVEI